MTFQQKYTPQSFGDLIFPDSNTRQRLLEFANNKRHGSLIFHGPYGTAKTTTAKILTEMRSEGLTYGGIDFYRACDLTHKSFERIANTRSMQVFADVIMPVTIVDEIDQVPPDLQYKLRWELDIQSNKGCFIFTTNKLHNVDAGLVDRCDVVQLPSTTTSHWFNRARKILNSEGVGMSDQKLQALLNTCDGSIRDLMRALEGATVRYPRAA